MLDLSKMHYLIVLLSLPVLLLCNPSPGSDASTAVGSYAYNVLALERAKEIQQVLLSCCSFVDAASKALSLNYGSALSSSSKSKSKRENALESDQDLVTCLNRTLSVSWAAYPAYLDIFGPTKTISILTRATPEIYDYSSYSLLLQTVYAARRGYSMIPLLPDESPKAQDYEYYPKVSHILRALTGHSLYSDYLVWMDADLVVLDMDLTVEELIYEHPQVDLFVSADVSSLINTGMMIFRNSMWTVRFLEKWLSFSRGNGNNRHAANSFTDQMGFEATFQFYTELESKAKSEREKAQGVSSKVKILPPHVLNSEASPLTRLLQSHKVLHLAAEHNSLRSEVFSSIAIRLCNLASPAVRSAVATEVNTDGSNAEAANALDEASEHRIESSLATLGSERFGITRKSLQITGNGIYFRLALKSIHTAVQSKQFKPVDMSTLYEMRQSASKYTHTFRLTDSTSASSYDDLDQQVALIPPILYIRSLTPLVLATIAEVQLSILKLYDHSFSRKLSTFKPIGKRSRILGDLIPVRSAASRVELGGQIESNRDIAWLNRVGRYHNTSLAGISTLLLNNTFSRLSSSNKNSGINQKDWDSLHLTFKENLRPLLDAYDDKVTHASIDESLRKQCKFTGSRDEDNPQIYISCISGLVSTISGQLPELLKLSAELHFELLTSLYPSESSSHREEKTMEVHAGYCLHDMECVDSMHVSLPREISNFLFVTLDLLEMLIVDQQVHIVLDMRASLLSLVGQFYLSSSTRNSQDSKDSNDDSLLGMDFGTDMDSSMRTAMDYLLASLTIYENDLKGSFVDQRAYEQTVSLLATAQCSSRQFVLGLASFKKVIDREGARLGPTHFQLIEKYTNAGYCALDTLDRPLAESYFNKAIVAIQANPSAHLVRLESEIRESLRRASYGKKSTSPKQSN